MKLLDCHIENFGKFHQQDFHFHDGFNCFIEENGYGKTTLGIFIRSMFYGFPKNTLTSRDRKQYRPYYEGKYGGYLDVEIKGKNYRIIRYFGQSASGDTFQLYDLKTKLPSKDYSEALGEEVFLMDLKSYTNVLFHYQNHLNFESGENIDRLLQGMLEQNDMDSYDQAMEAFKEYLTAYGPLSRRSKVVSLRSLEEDYYRIKEQLAKKSLILQAIQEGQNQLEELKESRAFNNEQKEMIQEKIASLNTVNELIQKKKNYVEMIRERNQIQVDPAYLSIDEDQLNQWIEVAFEHYQKEDNVYDLTREENQIIQSFEANPFTFNQLEDYYHLVEVYETNKKLTVLPLSNEERKEYNFYQQQFKYLKASGIDQLERKGIEIEYIKKLHHLLIIVGLMLIVSFLLIAFFVSSYGYIGVVCGIIICLFGSLKFQYQKENQKFSNLLYSLTKQKSDDASYLISSLKSSYQRYLHLEDRLKEIELMEQDPQVGNIYDALYDLGVKESNGDFIRHYYELKELYEKYQSLKAKKEELEKSHEQFKLEGEAIQLYLATLPKQNSQVAYLALKKVEELCQRNHLNQNKYQQLTNKIHQLEVLYDFHEDDLTIEEQIHLQSYFNLLKEYDNTSLDHQILEVERQIIDLQRQFNDLEKLEIELKEIVTRKEELAHKVEMVQKASKYLEEARNELNSQYSGKIEETFQKYFQKLSSYDYHDIMIDVNKNITYQDHSLLSSSEGERDLIYLCMRFTMIELLFKAEKPVILFDDPFTNLDDQKIALGLQLLEDLSIQYQIIYFTCHPSRVRR